MIRKTDLPKGVEKAMESHTNDDVSIALCIEDGDVCAYIALPKVVCKQKMLVMSGDSLDKFIKGLVDGVAKLKEAHNIP